MGKKDEALLEPFHKDGTDRTAAAAIACISAIPQSESVTQVACSLP